MLMMVPSPNESISIYCILDKIKISYSNNVKILFNKNYLYYYKIDHTIDSFRIVTDYNSFL
jgi:hypothetical protein